MHMSLRWHDIKDFLENDLIKVLWKITHGTNWPCIYLHIFRLLNLSLSHRPMFLQQTPSILFLSNTHVLHAIMHPGARRAR